MLFILFYFSATFSNLVIALSASCLKKMAENLPSLPRAFQKNPERLLRGCAKKKPRVCLGFKIFEDCIEFLKINNHFNNIVLSV